MKLVVTKDHIKLLRAMQLRWEDCEFGAPAVDCKRPYGNSSVYSDIAEILGIEPQGEDGDFTDEQEQFMYQTHRDTEYVLEIMIQDLSISLGTYASHDRRSGSRSWKRVEERTTT